MTMAEAEKLHIKDIDGELLARIPEYTGDEDN